MQYTKFQIPNIPNRLPDDEIADLTFTDKDVLNVMKTLSDSYAVCPDGLPTIFFKKLSDALAVPLSCLFRLSLDSGKVPDIWKKAIITPIPKKGASHKPADYRPVSLTCTACRIFEGLLRKCILDFLLYHGLISADQHGFMSRRSTATQMTECIYDWSYSIEFKKCVDIIYLDLAKAFDTVSHAKLLAKIDSVGVRGKIHAWLGDYFVNSRFIQPSDFSSLWLYC